MIRGKSGTKVTRQGIVFDIFVFSKVDFLYQFWKLKRKANFNRPLVALKRDEVDNLAQQEQDVLYRRLKLFTHLRQDLERVSGQRVCLCGNCVCTHHT